MNDESDGSYMKIQTILEIDATTIYEEFTITLGPVLHHIQQRKGRQDVFVNGKENANHSRPSSHYALAQNVKHYISLSIL